MLGISLGAMVLASLLLTVILWGYDFTISAS